ncbi:MAG: hypothetical protein CL931_04210 [Deltaproteobacteria bacterium]|nr:hypothetical protein [Deltaproteobacteria bacterium]
MSDDAERTDETTPVAGTRSKSERGALALRSTVREHVAEHLYLRPQLEAMLGDANWCVDSVEWDGDELEIRGWAITPPDAYAPATFTLDGRPFDEIDYPRARADIGELFWFRPGARYSGFVCRTTAADRGSWPRGFATIDFADRRSLAPFAPLRSFHLIDPDADALPIPEEARRTRVHGNDDVTSFLAQGASAFVKLERALEKSAAKSFDDLRSVLDWGCGCGRVSRYFARHPNLALTGIDIDASNVDWCRTNLPFARFETCQVDPPTGLESSSFDLLFGISVMTHLSEADREAWLGELARLARPGATALLTTQGASALCRSNADADRVARWRQVGMIDVGVSVAASDLSPEPDRYIDCFLTPDYIRDRWSNEFEVVDLLEGYIGNAQDLVVLRRLD